MQAFLYQPIEVSYDSEGLENITKSGDMQKMCRYTPDFIGRAELKAYVGSDIVDECSIEISDSNNHGYIEISKNDKKYFSYTDGSSFFVIGMNTAYPTSYIMSNGTEFGLSSSKKYIGLRQYESWFKKLSQNGCNVARLWLGHDYFSPDTENADEFNFVQFSKIDMVFELAKKYKIKLKITLEQFRYFFYDRDGDEIFRIFNKNLYYKNKRCEDCKEWLTDIKWRNLWLAKVNEFAKRYAGDTELFAVELWNEMNCVGDNYSDIVEWNKQVLPEVKKMFPNNLVVNSLGSLDAEHVKQMYNDFCWDKSSFVQIHRYLDQGAQFEDCRKSPIGMIRGAFEKVTSDKPVLIAETGAVNNCHSGPFKFYSSDDNGIIFADTVYTPVFCKSCGTGNIWHWNERYVESKNLYKLLRPINDLILGIQFDRENFESLSVENDNVILLLLKGKDFSIGYIRNKNYNWENVLRDLKEIAPADAFELNLENIETVELYPVWPEDTTAVSSIDSTAVFKNIKIGALFKIKHMTK